MSPSLRARALGLLARSERTRAQLESRLAPYGSAQEIAQLLAQLEADGLLSDARFADGYVASRKARYGAFRLRHELRNRGVPEAEIEQAVGTTPEDEFARAQSVHAQRFGAPPADARDYARQYRFLHGRGFAPDIVRRVLKEPPQ